MTIIAGIDPGKTGALVLGLDNGGVAAFRVPLVKLPKETPAWSEWWQTWSTALAFGIDMVVIENVGARPTQGTVSMFNFGRTLGFAHALAASAGAPIHFVTPAVWKGKLGLAKAADKSASREKARTLMPLLEPELRRVKDDGVAEAALLAYYGRKFI